MEGTGKVRLVGREGELAVVRAAVEAAVHAGPRVVVIDGPAGSGRTRLAAEAGVVARRNGLVEVGVRATPEATSDLGDLVQAAGSSGLLVSVDDAHWADAESLRVVAQLLQGPAGRPLVLLLTTVPGRAARRVAAALDGLRAAPETTLVALRPLSEEVAGELVTTVLGDPSPSLVESCVRRCRGLPALLVALAEDLCDADLAPDAAAMHVPERVRAATAARLDRVGTDAVAFAQAVHVLGDGEAFGVAAELAGLRHAAAARAADALVRDGVLQDTTSPAFTAPLIGSAVGATLTGYALAQLHWRAATLLAAGGRPDRDVAAHLLQATPGGEAWAVEPLVAEARWLAAQGRLRDAAATLARAVEERPQPDDLARMSVELAVIRTRLGEAEADRELTAALAAAPTREERTPLLREITRRLWVDGRMTEALSTCERALAESDPDSAAHSDIAAEFVAVAASHDVRAAATNPPLAALIDRARNGWVPDAPGLAIALAFALPLVLADHGLVRPLVDRGTDEALWDPSAAPFGLRANFAMTTLHWADELERAAAVLAAYGGVVEDDHARASAIAHWQTESCLATGDLGGACEAGARALEAAEDNAPWWVPFTAASVAQAQLDRGDTDAADAALLIAEQHFDPAQLSGLGARLTRARWMLDRGDAAAAHGLLVQVQADAAALGHLDGPAVVWRPLAAVAAAATGERQRACEMAEEEVSLARRARARGRLGQALTVAAAVGPPEAALDRLEEAVAVLATTGRRLELARTLTALGAERHRRGQVAGARGAAAEAREIAELCGSEPLAAAALACLRSTGARPRRSARSGPEALTASERRIAQLAARGLSNREIAEALVLAPRTIEWHLARVYTKLGVASRRELEHMLDDLES